MQRLAFVSILIALSVSALESIDNPAIDMAGYLRLAEEAARHRDGRRVTEDEFILMSGEPGTIILDARSREKYDELHVRDAVHLSFRHAIDSLRRLIPDRTTRILITATTTS